MNYYYNLVTLFFRILIQTGILIYGIVFAKRKEGDQGPPPATTNYMRAINKLASGKTFLQKLILM
jgi:hypothetical protein